MTVTESIPSLDISKISKIGTSIPNSNHPESLTERLNLPPYEETKLVAQTMYPSIPVKKPFNQDSDRKRFLRV